MKIVLSLLLIIVVLGLIPSFPVRVITPRELTESAIVESFYRIHLYAKANKKLPLTLDDLPRRDGYANRTVDGWGNELTYKISDSGIITLSSLGADQMPGGTGENADISESYRSINEDGVFFAGQELWIIDGELRQTTTHTEKCHAMRDASGAV